MRTWNIKKLEKYLKNINKDIIVVSEEKNTMICYHGKVLLETNMPLLDSWLIWFPEIKAVVDSLNYIKNKYGISDFDS